MALAVFRHERNAVGNCVGGCSHLYRQAVEKDAATVDRVGAEDRARGLGSLRCDKAPDTDDLAASEAEAHSVKAPLPSQLLHPPHFLAGLDRDLRELVLQIG